MTPRLNATELDPQLVADARIMRFPGEMISVAETEKCEVRVKWVSSQE
jgi:hypothetical protein